MRKSFFVMWIAVFTLAMIVCPCTAGQNATAKPSAARSGQMDIGVLAVVADRRGTLFVDGEVKTTMIPGKVVTLKLTAGQHFVDLRDTKGAKVWEKVVSVPIGAQVVEKIDLGTEVHRQAVEGKGQNAGAEITAAGSAKTPSMPKLKRRDELILLDRIPFPPLPCADDETKCEGVWDTDAAEVSKYCGEFGDPSTRTGSAGVCAHVLYDRGENEKALAKANFELDELEGLCRGFMELEMDSASNEVAANALRAASNCVEELAPSMPDLYMLRARIRYAMSDRSGALTDLGTAMKSIARVRKSREESARSPNKEVALFASAALALPRLEEMKAHKYRAVILVGMERYGEALSDYNELKTIRASSAQVAEDPYEKKLREVIHAHLASGQVATAQTPISSGESSISSQIDEIVRSGHYATLPPAEAVPSGVSQQTSLSIKNQTAYELTVLMAGPVERSLLIPPGGSQAVELPPGTYRVVGQVKASNVLPFFGTQAYATGSSYQEAFYIK